MTILTSRNGALEFGPGCPTLLINDQLNAMDSSPEVLAELRAGRLDRFLELARWGEKVGTDMVDIWVSRADLDEVALLPALAASVHAEIGCPISLDSRDPKALDAALSALRPYKALINSVSAETDSLETLLPLANKYGAAIVGMPIGHRYGLPMTVEGRMAEARVIVEAAEAYGISRQDIVIDAICMASAAEPDSMRVSLETIRALHDELHVSTVLGIGNAGFGMPEPEWIDLAYLLAAAPWGLDAALVTPVTPGIIESVRAADFLSGRDPYGLRFLQHYREKSGQ